MGSPDQPEPVLLRFYFRYLNEQDTAGFIRQVSLRYSAASLEKLVRLANVTGRRAAILALGYIGDFSCNATVGRALVDRDRGVRLLAEDAIRGIWMRAGSDSQRKTLQHAMRLNGAGDFDAAEYLARTVCDQAPEFGEAWNQLSIAYYLQQEYVRSMKACRRVLELNPYQFESVVGLGHCLVELDETAAAIECFQHALELHPGLELVRNQVARLIKSL